MKAAYRDDRGWRWVEDAHRDLRHTLRSLSRARGALPNKSDLNKGVITLFLQARRRNGWPAHNVVAVRWSTVEC
jgi:hypothetical protein